MSLDDYYKHCADIDKTTFKDLSDKFSYISRECFDILISIAHALGVYEEARGKWQFLEYSKDNQIFKKLGIEPDIEKCLRYEKIRKKNERIV